MIRIRLTQIEEKILILAFFNMLSQESAINELKETNYLNKLKTKSLVEIEQLIEQRELERLVGKYSDIVNLMEGVNFKSYYQKFLGYPFSTGTRITPNKVTLGRLLLVKQSNLQNIFMIDESMLEINFFYSMQILRFIFKSPDAPKRLIELSEWYIIWREIITIFLHKKGVKFITIFNENRFFKEIIINNNLTYYKYLKKKWSKEVDFFHAFFDAVFDYKSFIASSAENRFLLSQLMKTSVCPYCNRQYISVLKKEKRTTATFDHYKREATFPMLKISLFNLIPSCYACNSLFKGTKNGEHLYPWEDDDKGLRFSFEALDDTNPNFLLNYYSMNNCDDIQVVKIIVENERDEPKVDNSIRLFKLQDVYQTHNPYASTLLAKAFKYESGNYKKDIMDFLRGKKVLDDEKKIDEFLYGVQFDNDGEDKRDMNTLLYKMSNDLVKKVKHMVSLL